MSDDIVVLSIDVIERRMIEQLLAAYARPLRGSNDPPRIHWPAAPLYGLRLDSANLFIATTWETMLRQAHDRVMEHRRLPVNDLRLLTWAHQDLLCRYTDDIRDRVFTRPVYDLITANKSRRTP